jgi:polyisoprenoid-binding protein YceI
MLLLLLASGAAAAPLDEPATVWELSPTESHVDFTLTSVLHTIHGTFRLKRGSIRFDPAHAAVSGAWVVDATSGVSGNRMRDRKMHQEILASDHYPEIVFGPFQVRGSVTPQGTSQVDVDGSFTIHGASHPLTATVVVHVTDDRLTISTHFWVPYIQWGLPDPSTFVFKVGKQVEIHVEAAGRLVR